MTNTEFKGDTHIVTPEAGLRLDRGLTDALPGLSRNRVKHLINDGLVAAKNGTITDPSYRVKPGDTFKISVPPPEDSVLRGEQIPLNIHYEDDFLLVIDKPAGLTVHPGAGQPNGTLVNALIAHCGDSLSGIGGVRRPGIVHRLDKDTSGLMVAAKSDAAHSALSTQFEARTIKRAYQAFVWGALTPSEGKIESNIGRSHRNRTKMAVVPDNRGKRALTHYRTIERFGLIATLLECRLATGRTHQIRVHLAHIGHPLLGDPNYGRSTDSRRSSLSLETNSLIAKLGRQALHATEIGFKHPLSGDYLNFTSPAPKDMQMLRHRLISDTYAV
tara:strand:- start:19304 stop:20293 length:990 start_codon:yes stop_codon:yes gene_type:complete